MLEKHFPILKRKIHGHRLAYLDNAATTQKPREVIQTISNFYELHNANIHRGIHTLSVEATNMYESVREKVRKFLNAKSQEEIIFTSGATEGINLVAWTWGQENIHRGDEILLTEMEHHSNLVPWQVLAKKKGANLKFIPITKHGRLDLHNLNKLITRHTKLVSIAHISNVLGTVNPIEKITRLAHAKSAIVLVDGAQAGGHLEIDVQKLGCDFYVLSGHKMYGPTGVGILYGRKELLEKMPSYKTGGHMIKKVEVRFSASKSRTRYGIQNLNILWNDLPWKFEAGTANITDVIGLGAAIDFLSPLIHNSPSPPLTLRGGTKKKVPPLKIRGGQEGLLTHEKKLTAYCLQLMAKIPDLTIYGPSSTKNRIGVISFNLKGIPAHDLASILDEKGIAIRTGQHCAMPLHEKLGIPSSARASFAIYNTKQDVDKLIAGLKYAKNLLGEN